MNNNIINKNYESMQENLEAFEETDLNYYKWIYEVIKPYIGNRILEVGAGPGLLTQYLTPYEMCYATDVFDGFLERLCTRMKNCDSVRVEKYDILDSNELQKWRDRAIDTILCTGVLEHLEHDVLALKNMASLLTNDGSLILFVPALKQLYGETDSAIGHYRRYGKRELKDKLQMAGLTVTDLKYTNILSVVPWFIVSKLMKRKTPGSTAFKLFDRIVPVISKIEKIVPPIIGLNLVCVAKKGRP